MKHLLIMLLLLTLSAHAQPSDLEKRANEALKSDRHAEARQLFLQILAQDPNNFTALKGLGVVYLHENDPDQAEKYSTRALQLQPRNVAVLEDLGAVWMVRKNVQKATEFADQALAIDPNGGTANNFKGVLLGLNQEWDKAVPYLEKALKGLREQGADKTETVPRCGNSLAATLGMVGRWPDALQVCRDCLAQSPDFPELYLTASKACRKQKDFKQALQFATTGLERAPRFARLYASLSLSYAGLQDKANAEKAYQELLTRDPQVAALIRKILDQGGIEP